MGTFFKKDVLVFWRDRKEVLIALLLPILIIVVLNVAFSSLFNDDAESIDINVGIIQEDDYTLGLQQLEDAIHETERPIQEKEALIEQASYLNPSQMIVDFLNSPDLQEIVHTETMKENEAIQRVENGELDAIIRIPNGFNYEVLSSILLGEEANVALTIQADEQSTELNTLQNILDGFIESVNLQFAIGANAGSVNQEPVLPEGGRVVMEGVETFNISQYLTIAMCTLFALFMAQTVAMKSITEKRELVFDRIILTGRNPVHFLMGKTFATFCLAWIQMMSILVFSQLFVDVFDDKSFQFWIGLIIVVSAYALAISGLGAFFTSVSLNMKDTDGAAANGVATAIIMCFAGLGGNFVPIQTLPTFLQSIGEWTPNALTISMLTKWIQFANVEELFFPILILIAFFIVCFAIGLTIFPKRGSNQ